jgi:hypothetical protein
MAISGDYSSPVTVNGFACRNCADVDRAKRHIDPADPASGPFGINASGKAAGRAAGRAAGKAADKAGAAKNHFSAEARQQDVMAALHKARSQPAVSAAAAAYSGSLGGAAGQFVAISA